MAIYHSCISSSAYPTTATPLFEINAGPTDYASVLAITFSAACSQGGLPISYGVGPATSQGTATDYSPFVGEIPDSPAIGVTLINNWSILPGIPTQYLRRLTQNTSNVGPIHNLKFPSGIKIAPSSSLLIWVIIGAAFVGIPLYVNNAWATIDS